MAQPDVEVQYNRHEAQLLEAKYYDFHNAFIKQNIAMYNEMKPHIINPIACTDDGGDGLLLEN